jgi:hypothetical protein
MIQRGCAVRSHLDRPKWKFRPRSRLRCLLSLTVASRRYAFAPSFVSAIVRGGSPGFIHYFSREIIFSFSPKDSILTLCSRFNNARGKRQVEPGSIATIAEPAKRLSGGKDRMDLQPCATRVACSTQRSLESKRDKMSSVLVPLIFQTLATERASFFAKLLFTLLERLLSMRRMLLDAVQKVWSKREMGFTQLTSLHSCSDRANHCRAWGCESKRRVVLLLLSSAHDANCRIITTNS